MAGALAQTVNAMGPTGDMTHRHFYKGQEWIWQSTVGEVKPHSSASATIEAAPIQIWSVPVASTPPVRPPLASTPPVRPPLASAAARSSA